MSDNENEDGFEGNLNQAIRDDEVEEPPYQNGPESPQSGSSEEQSYASGDERHDDEVEEEYRLESNEPSREAVGEEEQSHQSIPETEPIPEHLDGTDLGEQLDKSPEEFQGSDVENEEAVDSSVGSPSGDENEDSNAFQPSEASQQVDQEEESKTIGNVEFGEAPQSMDQELDDVSQQQSEVNAGNDEVDEDEASNLDRESSVSGSDNESQQQLEQDVEGSDRKSRPSAVDLFGEDLDSSSNEESSDDEGPSVSKNKAKASIVDDEAMENNDMDESQVDLDESKMQELNQSVAVEEEEEEVQEETRIEVEIPKVNAELGEDHFFVKLPNFLSVETRPFDPMLYEDEIDEDDILDEEGRSRLKLKCENTIRWRNKAIDEEGNFEKESNSRFVKWSDGSLTLHLGKEIFDVHRMKMSGDYNHLFVRQGTGLQGIAVFQNKLIFRPHSTESFTHRKMTLSLAERSQKKQQIKVLPMAGKDPESLRNEMLKKEDEKLKASLRRDAQQRRIRERQQARGLNRSYLDGGAGVSDDEDNPNSFSVKNIKSRFSKPGVSGGDIYSDSDEENEETSTDEDYDDSKSTVSKSEGKSAASKKRAKAPTTLVSSDEESEQEASGSKSARSSKKQKKRAKISEDDEEEGGEKNEERSGSEQEKDEEGGEVEEKSSASEASEEEKGEEEEEKEDN